MIVDLHAHFPMHVGPRPLKALEAVSEAGQTLRDAARHRILQLVSDLANHPSPGAGPVVTIDELVTGNVKVVFSPLYSPFDEMDLSLKYASPPKPKYFANLLGQFDAVEHEIVATHSSRAGIAHNLGELDSLLADGKIAFVHAIEGGFHLGTTVDDIRKNTSVMARHGVAYITIAHLFHRQIATNVPALPFMPDAVYGFLFPQDASTGLTELGRALVEAMCENRILIDLTHLSEIGLREVFDMLDQRDPGRTIPVMVSHGACKVGEGKPGYNLTDYWVARIAERRGVIGVILCDHYMTLGANRERPKTIIESVDTVCWHIDHVREASGSFDNIAIGSDYDGFIKPVLTGLERPSALALLERALSGRYGSDNAEKICSGNAMRLLREYWVGAE